MKVHLLSLVALAFADAAVAQQVVRGRPPHTLFAPLQAGDHVATILSLES